MLGTQSTAVVTITDNQVTATNGTDVPASQPSYTSNPDLTSSTYDAGEFLSITPSSSSGFGGGTGPLLSYLEFAPSTAIYSTSYAVSTVDSVDLSLYNSAITGTYGGIPGKFDLYLLTTDSDALAAPTIKYSANGATGVSAIPTSFTPVLVGTDTFTNNYVGYNDFIFDVSGTVAADITADLNNRTPIRFAAVPSSGTPPPPNTSADWEGESTNASYSIYNPNVTLLVEKSASTLETFTVDSASATFNKGSTSLITVDRSSVGSIADAATIGYTITNGSAVLGQQFTTPAGTATGTISFAAGQSQATIAVTVPNSTVSGDTQFTFSINAPAPAGTGHIGALGTPSSETVTIHDPNTINLSASTTNTAEVQSTGPSASQTYLDILGSNFNAGSGTTNESFGVLDFNVPGQGNTYNVASGATIASIESASLGTINAAFSASTTGPLDVYLVSNTTEDISSANTNLTFNTSANAIEGLGSQLGTTYLLGTYNYNASQAGPSGGFTYTTLSNFNTTTAAMIASDLSNGLQFRIAITPETGSVGATYYGSTAFGTVNGVQAAPEAPILQFNVVESSLPAWLSGNSVATYDANTGVLNVTGAATIIDDPQKYGASPTVVVSGSGASLAFTPAVTAMSSTPVTAIHIGSLNLSGSATSTVTFNTSPTIVLIGGTNNLSIDTTSTLNLNNGDLDVAGGNIGTISSLIATGYNKGAWNGVGIDSSTAGSNTTHLTALGSLVNNGLYATVDGAAVATGDVLVKYTYYGDANLSGKVDGSDYSLIDSGFASHATGWYSGDFNYDGVVNGSDYTLIDNAFNQQGSAFPTAQLASPAAQIAGVSSAASSKPGGTAAVPPVLPASNVSTFGFSNKKVKQSFIDQVMGDLILTK